MCVYLLLQALEMEKSLYGQRDYARRQHGLELEGRSAEDIVENIKKRYDELHLHICVRFCASERWYNRFSKAKSRYELVVV